MAGQPNRPIKLPVNLILISISKERVITTTNLNGEAEGDALFDGEAQLRSGGGHTITCGRECVFAGSPNIKIANFAYGLAVVSL
jgi:hypothetical protein